MREAMSDAAKRSTSRQDRETDTILKRLSACICFHDLLSFHTDERPHQVAIRDPHSELTYSDFATRAERLADRLVDSGLRPGDRVALLAKNDAAFVDLTMAASMTGIVLVP